MITSKEDYKRYVAQDMKALGAKTRHPLIQTDNSMIWLVDPVARYQRLLRRLEYWENCRTSPGWLPLKVLLIIAAEMLRRSRLRCYGVPRCAATR